MPPCRPLGPGTLFLSVSGTVKSAHQRKAAQQLTWAWGISPGAPAGPLEPRAPSRGRGIGFESRSRVTVECGWLCRRRKGS